MKAVVEEEEEEEKEGKKFYANGLQGSYEWIREKLQEKAKPYLFGKGIPITEQSWVSIESTFVDKCVVSVGGGMGTESYYELRYSIDNNGEVTFSGEPKAIEIEIRARSKTMSEKQGRVLSKANEGKLRDAEGDLGEASKMEIPRGCKALIKQARMGIREVLTALGEDSGVEKEWTVKEALAFVLAKANDDELFTLKMCLGTFERGKESSLRVQRYKRLVGKVS